MRARISFHSATTGQQQWGTPTSVKELFYNHSTEDSWADGAVEQAREEARNAERRLGLLVQVLFEKGALTQDDLRRLIGLKDNQQLEILP